MADPTFSLLAEFESPDALVVAVPRARERGYRDLDTFTPFPVDGMAELLGVQDHRVPLLGLIGGCTGFALAAAMQILANFDYPLNVGGRPVYALSAFAVIAFELTVLCTALFAAIGMLVLNGLPRLHHPVFSASRIYLASRDRFFLCVGPHDSRFALDDTARFLAELGASSVERVPA